jgi:hypothetical protein
MKCINKKQNLTTTNTKTQQINITPKQTPHDQNKRITFTQFGHETNKLQKHSQTLT